ncbi:hypothetical protein [Flavobacterium sharifuzzamanii]|uniref:hypothetical protein n=1 Tax=Flavobacterium sharifuzzamanii TaxID=2211133 RepID=UPI000DAD896F|nr:hypothetical protein [Flavobacterium sharifuzzamanii]KAF2081921.1 hypothetical protein DMA14_05485 [Flavobacterium sharifuzzamanii]
MHQKNDSKINIWKEFANKTNGIFKEGYSWQSDSVVITYKNWKIIFDNYTLWSGKYSTEMTRIIVPINSNNDFRFEIYKEGLIRKIEKLFGAQDIQIGSEDFDKAFIIKSNNELKIKSLLRSTVIRSLFFDIKDVNIQISDQKGIWEQKLPENQFELSFYLDGKTADLQKLNQILELFKIILNELHQMSII